MQLEHCNIFQGFISCVSDVILFCILMMRHERISSFQGSCVGVCDSVVSVTNRLWAGQPRSCCLILVTSGLAVGPPSNLFSATGGGGCKVVFLQ
jgi:hypothetical protein